jgi:phosphotransferase system  glucose/maltose/N-acetylglucosamine-specific IIC component
VRFGALIQHLESCQGAAGATRESWKGLAHVILGYSGRLYIVIGVHNLPYAFSFEDAMAEDWIAV